MTGLFVTLAVIGTYCGGWLASTVGAAKWLARNQAHCQRLDRSGRVAEYHWDDRSDCIRYHSRDCWAADGEVTPSVIGRASAFSMLWPLLAFPAIAYWLATRKPTPEGLARRIAAAEREAGIEPWT